MENATVRMKRRIGSIVVALSMFVSLLTYKREQKDSEWCDSDVTSEGDAILRDTSKMNETKMLGVTIWFIPNLLERQWSREIIGSGAPAAEKTNYLISCAAELVICHEAAVRYNVFW